LFLRKVENIYIFLIRKRRTYKMGKSMFFSTTRKGMLKIKKSRRKRGWRKKK